MNQTHSTVVAARRRSLRLWPVFGTLHALVVTALVIWLTQATPMLDPGMLPAVIAGKLPAEQTRWLATLSPIFCFAWLATLAASWLGSLANFLRDRKLLRALSS